MWAAILEIAAKALGLTDFLVRRRAAKNDDPRNQIVKEKAKNEQAIADGDATRVTDLLDKLPNRKD